MKRKTIILSICSCLLIFIFGIVFLATLPGILMDTMSQYYESNPTEMIAYLNSRYSLIFPESISNVKAAKAMDDASGNYSFVMKFQIPRGDVNNFLSNFGKNADELQPYDTSYDYRSIDNSPEWFTSPIKSGRLGNFGLHAKEIRHISFPFEVYLDLSNDNYAIIYMRGNYKSDLD